MLGTFRILRRRVAHLLVTGLVMLGAIPALAQSCVITADGDTPRNVTDLLAQRLETCATISFGAGTFLINRTLRLPSDLTLRGTLDPTTGRKLTTLRAGPGLLREGNPDALFRIGTFQAGPGGLPISRERGHRAMRLYPLEPVVLGSREVRLRADADIDGLTAAIADSVTPIALLRTLDYNLYHLEFQHPTWAAFNRLERFDRTRGVLEFSHPIVAPTADLWLAWFDPTIPALATGSLPAPHVGANIEFRDLVLRNRQIASSVVNIYGCFACRFTNLEIHALSLFGGNGLAYNIIHQISGTFSHILFDIGAISHNNIISDIDVAYASGEQNWPNLINKIKQELGDRPHYVRLLTDHLVDKGNNKKPLMFYAETSHNNFFNNIRIKIDGMTFFDLIRVRGSGPLKIRNFKVEFGFSEENKIYRSLMQVAALARRFRILIATSARNFGSTCGAGTRQVAVETTRGWIEQRLAPAPKWHDVYVDGQRLDEGPFVDLSWPEGATRAGFADAAVPGAVVRDGCGRTGRLALTAEFEVSGEIATTVPRLLQIQRVLRDARLSRAPHGVRLEAADGTSVPLIDIIGFDGDRVALLLDGVDQRITRDTDYTITAPGIGRWPMDDGEAVIFQSAVVTIDRAKPAARLDVFPIVVTGPTASGQQQRRTIRQASEIAVPPDPARLLQATYRLSREGLDGPGVTVVFGAPPALVDQR